MTGTTADASVAAIADHVVRQFGRMVSRDGGQLSLIEIAGDTIRLGYRLGADPECTGGTCVLPHVELQTLIAETVRRRDPALKVAVELVT